MTSFTTTSTYTQSPAEVLAAVTDVRGWWSRDLDGPTDTVGAEFTYNYEDLHRCRVRVTGLTPHAVTWEVLENHFAFTDDQTEWSGTTVTFEVAETPEGTRLTFTHHGLVPTHECYTVCDNAWRFYVGTSLHNLITTGVGLPNTGQVNHVPPLAVTR